jgi:hypothetical protein
MLSVADTPVENSVVQLRGLLANDPFILPFAMVTAPLLVVQFDSVPFTFDGLVPPPDVLSGGENDTLADTEQLTPPGTAPMNLGARVRAEAGITTAPTMTIAAASPTVTCAK